MGVRNLERKKKQGTFKKSLAKTPCFWLIEDVYTSHFLYYAVVAELVDAQR